jgi:hypothetical protein
VSLAQGRCNRAKVSNGTRVLAGVDMRSVEGRRYLDLVASFAADLGGPDHLTETMKALIRSAAASVMASEALQAKIVRGEVLRMRHS